MRWATASTTKAGKFDPTGALRDWWSPEAAKSFTTRTDALVAAI